MMACEYGEEVFFDAWEDLPCGSGSCQSTPASGTESSGSCSGNWGAVSFGYAVWMGNPDSIEERRRRFVRDMGLMSNDGSRRSSQDLNEFAGNSGDLVVRRMKLESGTECSIGVEDSLGSFGYGVLNGGVEERENSESSEFSRRTNEAGESGVVTTDESQRSFGSSPFSARHFTGRRQRRSSPLRGEERSINGRKVGWLRRLGISSCVATKQAKGDESTSSSSDGSLGRMANRVRVHQCRMQSKEFSAVYMKQDVKAHDGVIHAMKFSPDGRYLATGGEDGVVLVWQVMECDFMADRDLPEKDPYCIYFSANHSFELDPMLKGREKGSKPGVMGRMSDAACIILPPKVFQISEKPVHEFKAHRREVLDLSWSKDKFLLSSSADKTVCLWQVGRDGCLKCFPHTDYVTCVQFNPVDENIFVSGSLDGKVRIWDIHDRHVISWSDAKDMVTAVCYRPDGKGIVVGSMGGVCSFYQMSGDNPLQLNERVCLQSKKKKYPAKRITGFQFCPNDSAKLMVTSANSQVKILDGLHIVGKYKGLRNATSQISASFTSDGRHIISASEDSNVHIWHHNTHALPHKTNRVQSTRSREHFSAHDVSIAIPWPMPDPKEGLPMSPNTFSSHHDAPRDLKRYFEGQNHRHLGKVTSSFRFALNQRFFTELLPKGSATWPEEQLPSVSAASSPTLSSSDYRFLKACCEKALASHSWGQVIVTASLDGHIRSYCNYGLPVQC